MGDDQHGDAFPGQAPHDLQDLAHHFRVQGGGGLIEEQDLGIHGQGTGDGHPLLLSTGDLPGLGVDVGGHAHLLQIEKGMLPCLFPALLQHLHLADDAVLQHGHIVEEVEGLEHHAHSAAVSRNIKTTAQHILIMIEDLAVGGILQQIDAAQQRGLAGAGSADDGDHIALPDGEIDVPQDLMGTEGF